MDRNVILEKILYKGMEIAYRKGTEDEKVLNHSFGKDIFFKEIPSFRPHRNPVIIDIGAHIGTFSILSSIKYPDATIYAYEASLDSYRLLEVNRQINNLHRIKIFHRAVAGLCGSVKLFHSQQTGNWGHSITKPLSTSFEDVEAINLSTIFEDNNIQFVDLIKFNCEGAEFDIIFKTPDSVLTKIGLAIILYHEDLYAGDGNAARLASWLKTLGFRVITIKKGDKRGWLIAWNKKRYSWIYFVFKAFIRRLKIFV